MLVSLTALLSALASATLAAAAWGSPRSGNWTGPAGGYGPPQEHNASFVPDHVLRLTYENVSIACQSLASVLINGTTPGPELRLKPGQTSWIRVYNDMTDYNATIVCIHSLLMH